MFWLGTVNQKEGGKTEYLPEDSGSKQGVGAGSRMQSWPQCDDAGVNQLAEVRAWSDRFWWAELT